MNKLVFLGFLFFTQVSFLMADEYISDAYFEEVEVQSEVMDESLAFLPITKTIEEEAREMRESQVIEEELVPSQSMERSTLNVNEEKQSIQQMSYENALKQAREEHKIIMLNIRATNCKYCDQMEEETLSDSSVQEAIANNFIAINYNQDLDVLPLNLQNGATPMFIFVDRDENIINMYPGIRTPEQFKAGLEEILAQ